MKYHTLKDVVELTSLIFTGIVVLEMFSAQTLPSRTLLGILVCAAVVSLIKFCFFPKNLFDSPFSCQLFYLFLVWLTFLLCNLFTQRRLTGAAAGSVLAEVLLLYFAIRLVSYQLVKREVKRMNERLEKSENQKRTSG